MWFRRLSSGFSSGTGRPLSATTSFGDAPREGSTDADASVCRHHDDVRFAQLRCLNDRCWHRPGPHQPIDKQTTLDKILRGCRAARLRQAGRRRALSRVAGTVYGNAYQRDVGASSARQRCGRPAAAAAASMVPSSGTNSWVNIIWGLPVCERCLRRTRCKRVLRL